jgi:hypothetical protein
MNATRCGFPGLTKLRTDPAQLSQAFDLHTNNEV